MPPAASAIMASRWSVQANTSTIADKPSGPKLTAEEIKEFREIFNLLDKDRGGTISKDELGELMTTLGIKASPEEIDLMVREVDEDGSGEIDFDEFVAVMSKKVDVPYSSDQVKQAFKTFENGAPSGYVRVEELAHILTAFGAAQGLTEARVRELIAQMEPDAQGMVNYSNYITMMMDQ